MKFILILLFVLFGYVRTHSWIACSDYAEKNGGRWDPRKCRGFARDSSRLAPKNEFGRDTGFNHQPGASGKTCKTDYSASSYSSEYPMAVYYRGQQVILVHPMKNHGSDRCTSQYIPDNGNALYRGRKWPNGGQMDTNKVYSFYKQFLVSDLGTSPFGYSVGQAHLQYPKTGYQNAPLFCENTDKAMGTYSFNVPSNIEKGMYTFVWRWSFNSAQDIYTTCFEVEIVDSKVERDTILGQRGITNFYVPCGGKTSSNAVGSSIGCDGSNTVPPTTTTATNPTPRPTNPTPGPTNPTSRPVQPTTRTLPGPGSPVGIFAHQFVGEVMLDQPMNGVRRRYVTVRFNCPVAASFWNARVLKDSSPQYELLQEQGGDLASKKLFFAASFDSPCDFSLNLLSAMVTMDE